MTVPRGLPFRSVDPQALVDDPRPERTVARDLVRHGLILGPLLILGCGRAWGIDGAISSGYAVVIVLVNFLLAGRADHLGRRPSRCPSSWGRCSVATCCGSA